MCCNDRSCRCSKSCWFSANVKMLANRSHKVSANVKMLVNKSHKDKDAGAQHGCCAEMPNF